MSKNSVFVIALLAAIAAAVGVIVVRLLGFEGSGPVGGAVGGAVGAVVGSSIGSEKKSA